MRRAGDAADGDEDETRRALVLAFLLLFRLGEAQLVKLVTPFLLDPAARGGMGLSTSAVGIVYGTVGVIALVMDSLYEGRREREAAARASTENAPEDAPKAGSNASPRPATAPAT